MLAAHISLGLNTQARLPLAWGRDPEIYNELAECGAITCLLVSETAHPVSLNAFRNEHGMESSDMSRTFFCL